MEQTPHEALPPLRMLPLAQLSATAMELAFPMRELVEEEIRNMPPGATEATTESQQ